MGATVIIQINHTDGYNENDYYIKRNHREWNKEFKVQMKKICDFTMSTQ